jgi:hypothetical protein
MKRPARQGIFFSANGANPSGNGNPSEVWRAARRSPAYGRFDAAYGVSRQGKGLGAVHGRKRPGKWRDFSGQRGMGRTGGATFPYGVGIKKRPRAMAPGEKIAIASRSELGEI